MQTNPISGLSACTTETSSALLPTKVRASKRVTSLTVRHPRTLGTESVSTKNVGFVCNGFEVIGVHAATIAT